MATPIMAAAPAQAVTPTTAPGPTAKAKILVDADTGRVLYEQDDHSPLPPGSLTKTLTAMIAAGWLPADGQVPVTAIDASVYPDRVGMKPGQLWPMGITMHALITDSANDAAYALAEHIGGSLDGFAAIMQEAGQQIGMSDHPVLEDPAGLDADEGFHGGNRISAWDLAIAARDMMDNPVLAAIAAERTYDFKGPDGILYHLLSRNYHFLASYPGAIGVKTGYTSRAGFCDIEEAQSGGRKMLAVVLGSNNPDKVAADLITDGFTHPADQETQDPTLPAVVEPAPPKPAPPTTTATPPTTTAAKVVQAAATKRGHASSHVAEAVGAAGVVVGVGLLGRQWRKRRQS